MTTDPALTLLYPQHVYRSLHSAYIDAVLESKSKGHADLHRWLLGLTDYQLTYTQFLLGLVHRQSMRESYVVTEDEDRAWVRLSAKHPDGDWMTVLAVDCEDLGLPLSYFAAVEAEVVDRHLSDLFGTTDPNDSPATDNEEHA